PLLLSLFFTDPAPTETYTLSLHDALPISLARTRRARPPCRADPRRSCRRSSGRRGGRRGRCPPSCRRRTRTAPPAPPVRRAPSRSEEHTSELQSRENLVCRLLLEKKKTTK